MSGLVTRFIFVFLVPISIISQQCADPAVCENVPNEGSCVDTFGNCTILKNRNHCEERPGYMAKNCPVTCNQCHLQNLESRCNREVLGIEYTNAILPGHFLEVFGRIENSPMIDGKATVLSRDPWIIMIDDFLFSQETSAIIDISEISDEPEDASDGPTRALCEDECESHPYVRNVIRKVTRTLSIRSDNFEHMQVMHYGPGEKDALHHDTTPSDDELASGMRVFTMLLYLNDVQEGGETRFPEVGVTVQPKRARALLWAGVRDEDPHEVDGRTVYEELPVIKGEKFSAKVWVRMYDHKTVRKWDCIRERE